jgi:hypothetical protein
MHTVPTRSASSGPPPPPAPSRGLVSWLPRDLVIGFALTILLNYAVAFFDEARKPLQLATQVFVPAFGIYIVTRVFWSWWRRQPPAMLSLGAWLALGVAVVSWLDVALAHGVKSINEGNYGLIVIGPAAMLIGLLVSLAGLAATGLGVIVAITALTRDVPKRGLLVVVGITAAMLNVAAIFQVIRIYSRG